MPDLQHGRIIVAEVVDPHGHNPKRRPLVVISSTEDANSGDSFECVAITDTLPKPLPASFVLLPFQAQGRGPTKLTKRSAANCAWIVPVSPSSVLSIKGMVPKKQLCQILEKVNQAPES